MDIRGWVMAGMLVVLAAGTAGAAELDGRWSVDVPASKASFLIRTTLHNVHGDSVIASGGFQADAGGGDVVFPVAGLKTYNNARDRNMYAMFESTLFPQIVYHLSRVTIDEGAGTAAVQGTLSIHGVSQDFPLTAQVSRENGVVVLRGTADVSLKSFSLKAPGVLGLIRVADTVNVSFTIALRPSA